MDTRELGTQKRRSLGFQTRTLVRGLGVSSETGYPQTRARQRAAFMSSQVSTLGNRTHAVACPAPRPPPSTSASPTRSQREAHFVPSCRIFALTSESYLGRTVLKHEHPR